MTRSVGAPGIRGFAGRRSNAPTLRRLAYLWAAPNTLLGLCLVPAALATGGTARRVSGVLEVEGGVVTWLLRRAVPLRGGALALTLGHVVLGRDARALERCRLHEHAHVRQCERWGPLFIPAYFAGGLRAWLRGGHPYWDNPFEKQARAAERAGGQQPIVRKKGRRDRSTKVR